MLYWVRYYVIGSIVALLVGIILGILIMLFYRSFKVKDKIIKKRINQIIERFEGWWFQIIYFVSTIYVILNFKTCTSFTFFDDFNGENLIFVVWLILTIIPLFENLEIMGFRYKRRKQNRVAEEAADYAVKSSGIMSALKSRKGEKHE